MHLKRLYIREVLRSGLACGVFMMSGAAWAQVDIPSVNDTDPLEEIERQREQQERLRDLENFERRSIPAPAPIVPQQALKDAGPCVDIDSVVVSGAERIEKKDELSKIIAPYVPDCLSRDKIGALMKEIDGAYVKRGLITSRAYIEQQDFKDRVLKLKVVEGVVEDIVFTDQNGKKEPWQRRKSAFSTSPGDILQLRDFEQGLDQINRLQSANATMKLAPGENAGGSIVNITVADIHRYRAFATWNNFGSAATGEEQIRVGVAGDNLLVANDTWSASYNGSTESNAVSLSGSIPVGYATLDTNFSASDFSILLSPTSELFGDTVAGGVSLNYVIGRNSNTKTFFSGGLNVRRGRRFINAVALEPQTLTTARFAIGHVIDTRSAKYSLDASYSRGLDLFGAIDDAPDNDVDPSAQFDLFEAGVTRVARPKKWGRWTVSGRVSATNDRLFGPQQTPLGSRSTIRGFRTSAISADIAGYIRTDVSLAMPDDIRAWANGLSGFGGSFIQKTINGLQPYAFADVGVGRDYAQGRTETVGGIGTGLRFFAKNFNFNVGGELPIATREFRENNAPRFLASIGVNWP